MDFKPMYTIVVRKTTEDDEEDITRMYFSSAGAIARNLPGIIFGRFSELFEAIEDAGKTVDEVVAFLADEARVVKELTLGNMTIARGFEVCYD